MSDSAHPREPVINLSTWTIDRVRSFAEDTDHLQELERIREVTSAHARRSTEPLQARLQWAMLSLQANERIYGNGPWERERRARNNFRLRTWVIDHLAPVTGDADWNPDSLAADTLAELSLRPAEARALATQPHDLLPGQIDELRRHKNMTAHLATLIEHIQPGPVRDQLLHWEEVRQHLP
jgi:hypothetical protein